MNECKYIEENMLNFLYDLLEYDENEKIKKHLKRCKRCREKIKKLLKVILIIKTSPTYKAPSQIEDILNRAKKELKKKNFLKNLLILELIKRMSLKVKIGITLFAFLILGISIFFIIPRNNYLYIIRASGNVKVNNKIFSNQTKFKYSLKRGASIITSDGEIIFQIDKDKLVLLKNNTHIKVEVTKDINIKILKGILIGKVVKYNNHKKLVLVSNNAKFKIIGTLFFIKRIHNMVEFAVKEGNVESKINNKKIYISSKEKLKISNNNITISKISGREDSLFYTINNMAPIKDFGRVRKIYVNTVPPYCDIYFQDTNIGKSPLFFLIKKDINESIYIAKKNYSLKEINISGKNDYIVELALKKRVLPQIVWKFKLKNLVFSNPLYVNGFIIVADSKGIVYKINAKNKNIIWQFKAKKRINSIPLYVNDVVYITSNDNFIYAIDFDTGALKWKQRVGTLIYSAPVYYKNKLYLCNSEGVIYSLDINGKILWQKRYDKGFFSTPVILNNTLYIGGLSGNFYSIDLQTRKINWVFKAKKRIVSSSPVIKNNLIFFGSNDKYIYAVDINTGKLKWKFLTNSEIFTSPLICGNMVLITTIKGRIYAFSYQTGVLKWKFDTNDKVLNTPYLITDKYIGIAGEKTFYIINKYGICYTKFGIKSTSFIITLDKEIFICGRNKYLYKFSINL